MTLQNRLTNDSLLFDRITATSLTRVSQGTSVTNATVSGTSDFTNALVIGLLGPDTEVTATNIGTGAGNLIQSADTSGNLVLRRLKAGTDTKISSSAQTVTVDVADNIQRGSSAMTGLTANGMSNVVTFSPQSVTVTGNVSLPSATISGLPDFIPELWTPTTNGDLMTFTSQGAAVTVPASTSGDARVLQRNTASPVGLSWVNPPVSSNITSIISPSTSNEVIFTTGTTFDSLDRPANAGNVSDPARLQYYLGFNSGLTYVDPSEDATNGPTASGSLSGYTQDIACRSLNASSAFGITAPTRTLALGSSGTVTSLSLTDASTAVIGTGLNAGAKSLYADGSSSVFGLGLTGFGPTTLLLPGAQNPISLRVEFFGDSNGARFGCIIISDDFSKSASGFDTPTGPTTTIQSGLTVINTGTPSGAPVNRRFSNLHEVTRSASNGTTLLPVWKIVPDWPSYSVAMGLGNTDFGESIVPVEYRIGRSGTESAPKLFIERILYIDGTVDSVIELRSLRVRMFTSR